MKKNILVIVLIAMSILMVISGCNQVEPDVKLFKEAVGYNWEMSVKDVLSQPGHSNPDRRVVDEAGRERLLYKTYLFDSRCAMLFIFSNKKLETISYFVYTDDMEVWCNCVDIFPYLLGMQYDHINNSGLSVGGYWKGERTYAIMAIPKSMEYVRVNLSSLEIKNVNDAAMKCGIYN